jgi:hypothetical protein
MHGETLKKWTNNFKKKNKNSGFSRKRSVEK